MVECFFALYILKIICHNLMFQAEGDNILVPLLLILPFCTLKNYCFLSCQHLPHHALIML